MKLNILAEESRCHAQTCVFGRARYAGVADPSIEEHELTANLLRFLRRTLRAPQMAYESVPVRVATGTEAAIFRFGVTRCPEWSGRALILRLSSDADYPIDVPVEHAVQNVVRAQGFPAPPVYASSREGEELGRPFVIMADACPDGEMDGAGDGMCTVTQHMAVISWLHGLDSVPLRRAFAVAKVPREKWGASIRYEQAARIINQWQLNCLRPLMEWVRRHRPSEVGDSICHGDPHAGNLLMHHGNVAALLDWSSARIGHAEADLGLLCGYQRCTETTAPCPADADSEMLQAYRLNRPCNEKLVRYYEAEFLVSLMASVGDQLHRLRQGLRPPPNPILDHPDTVHRLGQRLRQLISTELHIPERLGD
jgi:aminoglycoside phosphotransferase (APT) family kinase protein